MSTLHHEDLLLTIFEEVQEAFPYLDEEKQIEIANNRFQEVCQWTTKKFWMSTQKSAYFLSSIAARAMIEANKLNYDEILKCYEGETEEHANTSFEFGIMNELYYQLFREDF